MASWLVCVTDRGAEERKQRVITQVKSCFAKTEQNPSNRQSKQIIAGKQWTNGPRDRHGEWNRDFISRHIKTRLNFLTRVVTKA